MCAIFCNFLVHICTSPRILWALPCPQQSSRASACSSSPSPPASTTGTSSAAGSQQPAWPPPLSFVAVKCRCAAVAPLVFTPSVLVLLLAHCTIPAALQCCRAVQATSQRRRGHHMSSVPRRGPCAFSRGRRVILAVSIYQYY